MEFKGDIIIIDPSYVMGNDDDWYLCGFGKDMSKLGFEHYLYIDMGDEYGNKVVNTDTNELIGKFCTDSCMLVVLDFNELMKYNPKFSDHIKWPNSNTVIKGFNGTVTVCRDTEPYSIVGTGNINFRTVED